MKRSRFHIVCLLVLAAVLLLAAGAAVASSGYTLESETSIDTPSKTVSVQGETYTVSSLGYRDVGETLPVEVSRPGDSIFTVYLYNGDGQIMDSVRRTENGTYTLDDTTSLERGTYVLALTVDGSRQAVQPVVMSGYDFAVDAPSEVSEGERVTVTIELTGDTELPNYVDLAVMNDSTHRYVATKVDDRTYSVTFDDLAADEYEIYAATRGEDEVNGRDEVTGVSSVETLTISSNGETTTESSGGSDPDPGTSDSDDSSGTPSTDATTTVPTNTAAQTTTTPGTTPDTTTSAVTPVSPHTDASTSTSTDGSDDNEAEPTSNDSNVIDPSTPTETQPGESDASTPMFPLNVVGALIVSVLLIRREGDR
ncbi:hypothetical protein [Halobellus captivus]|uniref:hypothetical protein n=1 Tax=Halobellus captivus TaxID=2592614 RepID=UPI00119E868A|nr:hypothetical protein [Halobellus captivus]